MVKDMEAIQMPYTGKQIHVFPGRKYGDHMNEEVVRRKCVR